MRAVLDTNVIVSSVIRLESKLAELLTRIELHTFDPLISDAILDEYKSVLKRPKFRKYHALDDDAIDLLIDRIFSAALLTMDITPIRAVIFDHKDDKFIECAVAGGADVIVSGDKHLLALGAYERIRIVTPAEFIALLDDRAAAD